MADADQQETSQETQGQQAASSSQGNTSKLETELASVKSMLESMNQSFAAAAASAQKPPQQRQVEIPDPVYDKEGYTSHITQTAAQIAREAVARERELNSTVYQMAQDYPEISSDAALKKSIQEIQRTLPENIRDTALGYETAILKAANKAGLVPKSKRGGGLDDDTSIGAGRGSSGSNRSSKKQKVDPDTLEVARLLGRNVEDPAVIKGLEAASQRTRWGKFE